jgi:hypothetical protein
MINIKFVYQARSIDSMNHLLFQIVYEIDSLQKEIDKRRRNLPQTYKEAMNRAETVHEINRLYDVCENFILSIEYPRFYFQSCERAVRRFRTTAEIMIEHKHPEYELVEQEIKDIEKKLSIVYISIGDYRQYMDKTTNYYKLIDEVQFENLILLKNKSLFDRSNVGMKNRVNY